MSKPLSEKQSRQQLIDWARKYGCETDLLNIFKRHEDALKGCKTEKERKTIVAMGILEIDRFFGGKGDLTIDGKSLWDYLK